MKKLSIRTYRGTNPHHGQLGSSISYWFYYLFSYSSKWQLSACHSMPASTQSLSLKSQQNLCTFPDSKQSGVQSPPWCLDSGFQHTQTTASSRDLSSSSSYSAVSFVHDSIKISAALKNNLIICQIYLLRRTSKIGGPPETWTRNLPVMSRLL